MNEKRKEQTICPKCGVTFSCGVANGEARCWCFDLPPVLTARSDTACLCPACLRQTIQQKRAAHQR